MHDHGSVFGRESGRQHFGGGRGNLPARVIS